MVEEKTTPDVKDKKKVTQDNFIVGEVATQTATVIKNNVTGDIMTESQALALLLNKIERLERGLL